MINSKCIHRSYSTPWRCFQLQLGLTLIYLHTMWECLFLVTHELSEVTGVSISCLPNVLLLNDDSVINLTVSQRRLELLGLILAKTSDLPVDSFTVRYPLFGTFYSSNRWCLWQNGRHPVQCNRGNEINYITFFSVIGFVLFDPPPFSWSTCTRRVVCASSWSPLPSRSSGTQR